MESENADGDVNEFKLRAAFQVELKYQIEFEFKAET